jgi:hypothetical protein
MGSFTIQTNFLYHVCLSCFVFDSEPLQMYGIVTVLVLWHYGHRPLPTHLFLVEDNSPSTTSSLHPTTLHSRIFFFFLNISTVDSALVDPHQRIKSFSVFLLFMESFCGVCVCVCVCVWFQVKWHHLVFVDALTFPVPLMHKSALEKNKNKLEDLKKCCVIWIIIVMVKETCTFFIALSYRYVRFVVCSYENDSWFSLPL